MDYVLQPQRETCGGQQLEMAFLLQYRQVIVAMVTCTAENPHSNLQVCILNDVTTSEILWNDVSIVVMTLL